MNMQCLVCGARYQRDTAPAPGWIMFSCPKGHDAVAWKPKKAPK